MPPQAAVVSPEKRPNGRSRPTGVPAIRWLRRGLWVTEKVSPAAAAAFADELFFRPARNRPRPEEQAALRAGREFRISVGGQSVVGWAWGGGGAPVLLVHGWAGYAGQMTPLVPALTAAGFRVVAADMPGHGRSEGATSSVVHFADTVAALHETFGPFAGAVGHSMGAGAVTLALGRGVPMGRAVFYAPPEHFERFWARFREGLGVSGEVWRRMQARAEARLQLPFSEVSPLVYAPRLATPLLVLHDEDDREIPIGGGEALVAAWPGAALVRTRGLGHNRILRDPALARRAAGFLAAR